MTDTEGRPPVDERLRRAIKAMLDELGVPGEGYPAPVANAVEIGRAALAATPAPLDVEHASEAHYAQAVNCGDETCPLNWARVTRDARLAPDSAQGEDGA